MQENNSNKSIKDKLTTIKYNCSNRTHLVVDQQLCDKCNQKPCTFICPAKVYSLDESTKKIVVEYENCLECGACKIVCPHNSITWCYPQAGCGVIFKNS